MIIQLLLAVFLAGAPPIPFANSAEDVTKLLRAKDQALLDAIAPGDTKTWDAALADNAVYVDENGEIIQRAEFMKQLQPLAAGASGKLVIDSYEVSLHGDVATVIHTDDEEENYHGQILHARYLTTETWQKTAVDWKLLLVHAYAVQHDPPAQKLPPAELDAYTGQYRAGDLVYIVRRENDHLVGGREGKAGATLNAEVRDVFFVAGQARTRKIFQRNHSGKVTGYVDRREGIDLVWTKAP
jgi:ketosteroid isomerase-like protein